MRVVELRVHSRARGILLPSRLARCRARCAPRIECFPDASEFYIAGTADRYHLGGRLLRVYPQHQTPDISAAVDSGVGGFRASLCGADTRTKLGGRPAAKCAESLAVRALRSALFSGRPALFPAEAMDNSRCVCR